MKSLKTILSAAAIFMQMHLAHADVTKPDIRENPFGYSGYLADKESGLCYCRSRYYSPELQSFISRDTFQVRNRYDYCNNNPVAETDPSGHSPGEINKQIHTISANQRLRRSGKDANEVNNFVISSIFISTSAVASRCQSVKECAYNNINDNILEAWTRFPAPSRLDGYLQHADIAIERCKAFYMGIWRDPTQNGYMQSMLRSNFGNCCEQAWLAAKQMELRGYRQSYVVEDCISIHTFTIVYIDEGTLLVLDPWKGIPPFIGDFQRFQDSSRYQQCTPDSYFEQKLPFYLLLNRPKDSPNIFHGSCQASHF